MKIDRRRKYYIVFDVETANDTVDALVYDLGYAVVDKHGKIYKTASLIVSDIFFNEKDLMQSAYYSKKLPMYYYGIKCGTKKVVSLYTAREMLKKDIEDFKVEAILAYNAAFDKNALTKTQRYVTKSKYRFFIPYNVPIWCIWNMACNTICNTKGYINFCLDNGLMSAKGNILTSAEAVYSYLTCNTKFEEEHTGLADVLIEADIFAECVKRVGITKIEKRINRACWRVPQKLRKEIQTGVKEETQTEKKTKRRNALEEIMSWAKD